jgi:enamine deaminase RidA (YjgF/YER057c/UK114 family)
MHPADERLAALGFALPPAREAVYTYRKTVLVGSTLYVSGHVSAILGRLGHNLDVVTGASAARECALGILATVRAELQGFARVRRFVKLTGFVHATPDFTQHPLVINGASDLLVEVFGDAGMHARSAIGVGSLPNGCAVEIEAILDVAPA